MKNIIIPILRNRKMRGSNTHVNSKVLLELKRTQLSFLTFCFNHQTCVFLPYGPITLSSPRRACSSQSNSYQKLRFSWETRDCLHTSKKQVHRAISAICGLFTNKNWEITRIIRRWLIAWTQWESCASPLEAIHTTAWRRDSVHLSTLSKTHSSLEGHTLKKRHWKKLDLWKKDWINKYKKLFPVPWTSIQ